MKKILVGCPTSFHKEYALKQYAEAVKKLTYPNHDILLVDNSKDNTYFNKIKALNIPVIKGPYHESARDRIIESRNILRQKVLGDGYDYFFSLEQDVLPPPDILEQLLKSKKRIISAIYLNYVTKREKIKPIPLVWKKIDSNLRYGLPFEQLNQGVISIAGAGLGCILIHRSILQKVKFRYDKEHTGFDDVYFMLDCKENNSRLYADTDLICKHLIDSRPLGWEEINQ